jgi:molecular chaperone HtpG
MVSLGSYAEKKALIASDLPAFSGFSLREVKEKVAEALDTIGKVNGIFATYTKHDISHIDRMLSMLEWLIPPTTKKKMTTADWLIIVLSIYFHDFGMIVTNEEYDKRSDNPFFLDFLRKVNNDSEGKKYVSRIENMSKEEQEKFLYQEFVRSQHATRIREWITGNVPKYWGENIKSLSNEILKILEKLPTRSKQNLADICESHHKDDLDNISLYPLCQRYGDGNSEQEIANVQYAAIILRTADLLHVTQDRAPSIMYKIVRFSDPKSVNDWQKQRGTFSVHMKNRKFDEKDMDSHFIVISADFQEEKPFFSLTEYVAYANDQIIQSKRWVEKSQKDSNGKDYSFPWLGVKGDIRVEGNSPYQMNFELDRGRLLDLLVGHTIYNDPTVAIRELLQNAIDAVRFENYTMMKNVISPNDPLPEMGRVIAKWDPEKRELIIEDNGIGMDLDVIKYHLMCVGSSFYNTPTFQLENSDYSPISRFGIGVLTCFMISDDIEIVTCKKEGGFRIKMSSVQGSYLLKKLDPGNEVLESLEPHGTRVKLKIRQTIDLDKMSVLDIIRYWVILPECKVIFIEKDKTEVHIGFEASSEALRSFSTSESAFETKTTSKNINGAFYELSYVVESNRYAPFKNFGLLDTNNSDIPAVCIEGIRADKNLPGFTEKVRVNSILSIKGNRTLQTTVSRTSLERDEEYKNIGMICSELFCQHIKEEVERISQQNGEPLSQASTSGLRISNRLLSFIEDEEISEYITKLTEKILIIVLETTNHDGMNETFRKLISKEELKSLTSFWAIESRLVDSLGIISRDLGRELSLNGFLGKLAPELIDNRISPILPDAHLFTDLITESHKLSKVEFSQKNQQTVMKWELITSSLNEDYIRINLLPTNVQFRKYLLNKLEDYRTYRSERITKSIVVAPIKGDIERIRGINTRIVTILKPGSKFIYLFQLLKNVIQLLEFNLSKIGGQDVEELMKFAEKLSQMASSQFDKTYSSKSNCYIYTCFSNKFAFENITFSELTWQRDMSNVNRILDNLGMKNHINVSINELIAEGEVFDTSVYWLNWNTMY